MNARLTKEKVLFLLGALLLAWVAFRLGVCAARRAPAAGPAALAAYSCQQGDPHIADSLATPPLSRCLGPGDPFGLAGRGVTLKVVKRPPKPEIDWVALLAKLWRPRPGSHREEGTQRAGGGGQSVFPIKIAKIRPVGPVTVRVPDPPPPPSLELAGTLRREAVGASEWALLRDRTTRALLSGTVGDVLPGSLRVHAVRDDDATLITPQGTHLTFPGRFGNGGQPY